MTHERPVTGLQDGPKIRQLRSRRKVNVTTMAARIGIHPQSLSNIENNAKAASLATLMKIAGELGVPLDVIVRDMNTGGDGAAA